IHRGHDLLRRRRLAVRDQCRALDPRVRALGAVARRGAVDRINRAVVLVDPAFGRDLGGEPVLSGAGGDRADGLSIVRRAARRARDRRHGRLRRGGVSGQSPLQRLSGILQKSKAPGFRPGACCDFARLSASTSWPSFSLPSSSKPSWLPSWWPFSRPSCPSWPISLRPSWLSFWLSASPSWRLSWRPSCP